MQNRSFFLDTADPMFIVDVRNQLRGIAGPKSFLGVTTNPKAVAGYCKDLGSARSMVEDLGEQIADYRGDNEGQLFLQLPGSLSSFEDCVRFIEHTYNWGRQHVKLGYKLPHHRVRDLAYKLQPWNQLLNVTGVTAAETVVECAKAPVTYISLLTGRMEERGIDAKEHVRISQGRLNSREVRGWDPFPNRAFRGLIAGSMRTLEQLEWCWADQMLPTIGRSLWTDVLAKQGFRSFQLTTVSNNEPVNPYQSMAYGPEEQRLSEEFFTEMDGWSVDSQTRKIWG